MNSNIWINLDSFGLDSVGLFILAYLICLLVVAVFFVVSIKSHIPDRRRTPGRRVPSDFEPITPQNRYSHSDFKQDMDDVFGDETVEVQSAPDDGKEFCGRCMKSADESFDPPCAEMPELLTDSPIGMYHCPDCGMMLLAGFPHPRLCRDCLLILTQGDPT